MKTPAVYIAEAENGMIKIGFSGWPESRVKGICSGSPVKARLVAILPESTRKAERELHRRFAKYRAWNEWFRCEGDLAEFVASVFGHGIPGVVDWSEIVSTAEARQIASRRQAEFLKEMWANPAYRAARARSRQALARCSAPQRAEVA